MTISERPFDETGRLQELTDLQLLHTAAEPAFDNLAQLASEICETPVALMSLVDQNRVWFKSRVGLDDLQAPRQHSFCSHAIEHVTPLIIEDASTDVRFQNNQYVLEPEGVRFYAGVPLVLASGFVVGCLCVIDHKVRTLSDKQLKSLNRLAIQAVALIEAKLTHVRLLAYEQESSFSEQRLDFALSSAEIGEWERDLLTGVTRRSLTHDRIFGYAEAVPEWNYEIFLSHVVEADRARVDAAYQRAKAGAGTVENEYRVIWPDGSTHWLWGRGRFYFDMDGKLYKAAGIVVDITGRKQTAEALQYTQDLLSNAEKIGRIGGWDIDIKTLQTTWTEGIYDIYELDSTDRLIVDEAINYYTSESQPIIKQAVQRAVEQGEPFDLELEIISAKGKRRSVRAVGKPDQARSKVSGFFQDITEQLKSQARVQHLAYHDTLTGLPNRTRFLDFANQLLRRIESPNSFSAAILFDLDNFKRINDQWGHRVGDELLKQVALRIQKCIPPDVFLARLGGDEFILIVAEAGQDRAGASVAAQDLCVKIIVALAQGFTIDQREHFTSASLGIALFGEAEMHVDELLSRADSAMYSAKAEGRNTFRFFDGQLQAQLAAQSELEDDLRQCIHNNELSLVYQPQVDRVGRMVGSEVLLRWTHPRRGMVSPAQFIPAAESSGFILQIGRWVLHTACLALAKLQSEPSTAGLTMAVNVSAKQFHHPDFVSQVLSELESSGANPALLKLELTESLLAQDLDGIIQKMNALKAKGIVFSLDDFGTGYSSLVYLKRLPLDQIKIDQGFVRDIMLDASDAAIVRTVIALGEKLGLSVIAEGVETQAQRDFLESNGCYFYQGYLYGRPLKLEDFEALCAQALCA